MKVIFCGPSLPFLSTPEGRSRYPDLQVRPPARQGDLLRAARAGATGIGLVDGHFEHVPAVWHKEILYALKQGIFVCGGASMGALRAAECVSFGMMPIGRVADDFVSGRRIDDADVAQIHGPEALGYPSLSEPLVNVEAVLAHAEDRGLLDRAISERLGTCARNIFFKDRTWPAILRESGIASGDPIATMLTRMARLVNPKRDDALLLAGLLNDGEYPVQPCPVSWELQVSRQLGSLL